MCFFLPLCAFGHGILHLCICYIIFCTYIRVYICTLNACSSFGCSHMGEYPLKPQIKMEYFRISAVCCTSVLCLGLQVVNTHYTLPACLTHQVMNVHYWCSVYIRQCCFILRRFSSVQQLETSTTKDVCAWRNMGIIDLPPARDHVYTYTTLPRFMSKCSHVRLLSHLRSIVCTYSTMHMAFFTSQSWVFIAT